MSPAHRGRPRHDGGPWAGHPPRAFVPTHLGGATPETSSLVPVLSAPSVAGACAHSSPLLLGADLEEALRGKPSLLRFCTWCCCEKLDRSDLPRLGVRAGTRGPAGNPSRAPLWSLAAQGFLRRYHLSELPGAGGQRCRKRGICRWLSPHTTTSRLSSPPALTHGIRRAGGGALCGRSSRGGGLRCLAVLARWGLQRAQPGLGKTAGALGRNEAACRGRGLRVVYHRCGRLCEPPALTCRRPVTVRWGATFMLFRAY